MTLRPRCSERGAVLGFARAIISPSLVVETRGEKDVEQDPIVGFDFEKFNADSVLVYPLDRSETHFHRRLVPGKIHHECELLARPK